ncbi:TMV resistance protein N-like [Prunus avium]|uniref:TMV resistance protein N-like n=1 Tax=Prunus avium TaxID=42229 RepID=A0A6P5TVS7_PRUAV|nr:TMV resistance protein N-like [Prunus avium]
MDATSTALASSSPSNSSKHWKYDVFLSFRGEDTRKNFTDHLYCTLIDNRVNAYIDEKELPRGENISEELKQAIEQSRISVIVFSNGYADSTWCLEELEKIMECRRRRLSQMVFPIFYDVDPTQVRKQTGSFAEAFQRHEANFPEDKDKIQRWRSALFEAANLAGGNLKNNDGYEGKFVEKIVAEITRKLNNICLHVATNEIGMTSRMQEVSNYLHVGGSDDVRIIGIWGMIGTGKTTVAKAIFNKFYRSFQGESFLEVSKGDMVKLQKQLLYDILKPAKIEVSSVAEGTKKIKDKLGSIKVLVIFDHIDSEEQLCDLAINRDSFGPGSRIIITTRNKHFLEILEVDETYLVPPMSEEEAFQLLCCRAFTKHHPNDEGYLKLLRKVAKYCGGLPWALEVLGYLS